MAEGDDSFISTIPWSISQFLAAVWFETLLYGAYATLFLQILYMTWRRGAYRSLPAKVTLSGQILLFLIATFHAAINLYRLLRGFSNAAGNPLDYFALILRWEHYVAQVLVSLQILVADGLLLYRCYFILTPIVGFRMSLVSCVLPLLLWLAQIATNFVTFIAYYHNVVPFGKLLSLLETIYPLAFATNSILTGLISFHIWRQHVKSRESGARERVNFVSRPTLMTIVRIVIESAVVYEVLLLILIILATTNGQLYICQTVLVPVIGSTFAIISLRMASLAPKPQHRSSSFNLPTRWAFNSVALDFSTPPSVAEESRFHNSNASSTAGKTNSGGLIVEPG